MTPCVTEVFLSAPELRRGRQTPGPDPERAIVPPAHPHQHPHTFVPTARAEGHPVLAGGSSWSQCVGRPVDPRDEVQEQGPQSGTVLGTKR